MTHFAVEVSYMTVRVHTAPPAPSFIHCAHEMPQPPLGIPDQFMASVAPSSQFPLAGNPNCWISEAGAEPDALVEPPPPLPDTLITYVKSVLEIGLPLLSKNSRTSVPDGEPL